MKIVFLASEMVPYAKTGGLADVAGTLSKEIQLLGNEVTAFLPRYRCVDPGRFRSEKVLDLDISIGSEVESGQVLRHTAENGLTVYFIEHKGFFDREELYGAYSEDYPDNDKRFIFFQRAVLETLKALKIKPHLLHCHDWQTGLIPVYVKSLYAQDSFFQKVKTVFTIHNLAYQGQFPPDSLPLTGLDWQHFTLRRLEFYGKLNFLKGGIIDADAVTTVSDRYSKEIQTKEFGCGLEGVLSQYKDKLTGIVNGIDYREWDPAAPDGDLASGFTAEDLPGKARCKEALQSENGLRVDPQIPLAGVVSRLVDQKGIDILLEAVEGMMKMGLQFILLGTGDERYHKVLRELARKRRERCSIHILFDAKLAKRIYAGSDMMLMPSYYEPCGLGQMIALRYGTVPVVRATGGLADTVEPFNPVTEKGNGFVFEAYRSAALLEAIEKAAACYKNPSLWAKLVRNAMESDFSWAASAKKYFQVYKSLERRPSEGLRK